MDEIIKECQALARKEDEERANRPEAIGSTFLKCVTADGPILVNINSIQSIFPCSGNNSCVIFFPGEEDRIIVRHSLKALTNTFKYFK